MAVPAPNRGLDQYIGQVIPYHFSPAIVALSFIVSFIGAASTVELINRRTSRKGRNNHLLLLGSSITMGGVAIWCMHYIGNRATSLLEGEPEVQITYTVGITVLSFFVPILVLLVAFFFSSGSHTASWWRIGVSGILSGGAICGMHYLGNASISNYTCTYMVGNVIGSAAIACAASTIAMTLFFVFRAAWANSWWKRIGCAIVLAGAVSGMHWCALLGTTFRLVRLNSNSDHSARNTTVIVVGCLSVGACFVMAGTAIYQAHVRKRNASKAQRITLAAAVFDMHGRILVTPDGLLPSEEITSTYVQKTQNDVFSTSHPLFQWVFQVSRNWSSISNLVDRMGLHVASLPHTGAGRSTRTDIELVDQDGHIIDNYDIIFRELFCLAAAGLAAKMHQPLDKAGVLWDGIFATGGNSAQVSDEDLSRGIYSGTEMTTNPGPEDLAEKGIAFKSRRHGSLMFLVRKVEDIRDIDNLEAAGYCFADLRQVSHIIGSSMQIRTRRLEERLRFMAGYDQDRLLEPGVHLSLFAVRARVDNFMFDILAQKQARNLLPAVKLPIGRLEPENVDFIRRLDGLSVAALLQRLKRAAADDAAKHDTRFASMLYEKTKELRLFVSDPIFDDAKLMAHIAQAPCSSLDFRPSTCSLITFSLVIPIHTNINTPQCELLPLQFFKTQQLVYKHSPHHASFARSVHREISPILNSIPSTSAGASRPSRSAGASSRRFSGIFPSYRSNSGWPFRQLSPSPDRHQYGMPTRPSTAGGPGSGAGGATGGFRSSSRERITNSSNHSTASLHLMNSTRPNSSKNMEATSEQEDYHNAVTELARKSSAFDDLKLGAAVSPKHQHSQSLSLSQLQLEEEQQQQQPPQSSWGGIMVSQEITVDVDEVPRQSGGLGRRNTTRTLARPRSMATLGMGEVESIGRCSVDEGLKRDPQQNLATQRSNGQQGGGIELKDVSGLVLGGGGGLRVEVKKEDVGEAVTFVDELFGHACIDTPLSSSGVRR